MDFSPGITISQVSQTGQWVTRVENPVPKALVDFVAILI